jgi:hypothetical protein
MYLQIRVYPIKNPDSLANKETFDHRLIGTRESRSCVGEDSQNVPSVRMIINMKIAGVGR